TQLGKALAYGAALRVARYGESNEVGDWISALHSFSYCNAVAQSLGRGVGPQVARAVLHGAISIYLTRFLNVPPAKLPRPSGRRLDAEAFRIAFLAALDSQQNLE